MNSNGSAEDAAKQKFPESQTKLVPPTAPATLDVMAGVLPNKYSFSDITEESHNSSQQSDVNSLETSLSTNPNGVSLVMPTNTPTTTSDVNPLLDDSDKVERRKRPQIVKRSPNFARAAHTRVHPMSMPPQGFEMVNGVGGIERPVIFPSSLQAIPTGRPLSMQFKRSTSEVDLPEYGASNGHSAAGGGIQGHRRSQSYGAPGAYLTQPGKYWKFMEWVNIFHKTDI